MVFPNTILERVVQAYIGGTYVDVTQWIYQRDSMLVTRGGGSERSTTQPVRFDFTLDNRDGRWSPRNPAGPWFGLIGRNTLIACSVRLGECYLLMGGANANYITAPDSAGLSVTGDLDVRLDVTLQRWRGLRTDLAGKYGAAGQQSWAIDLLTTGQVRFTWSTNGTAITQVSSTIPIPWPMAQRATLRCTLDVNNGAGGYTVAFYYSTTDGVAGPWTTLGDPVVTTAGVTSVFDSTAAVCFGTVNSGSAGRQEGRVHAAEIRNGIGGSVVASPNVRTATRLATSFSDGTNTWTVTGSGAQINNFRTEFVGEIPDFKVDRDVTGRDIYVRCAAQGITRRLGQGQSPVQSTLRRGTLPALGATALAYWPFEDGADAAFGVSAFPGGSAMRWGSPPALATYSGFAGSAPIPTMNGSAPRGTVKSYTSTGAIQVRALVAVPSGGAANGAVLLRITTGGTSSRWDLIYGTGGTLQLRAFDSDGTDLGGSAAVGFTMDGRPVMVQVDLLQNGANVDYDFSTVEPAKNTGGTFGGSVAGRTVTTARAVQLNPGGLLTDTAIGHVSVASTITSLFVLGRPLAAYAAETAGRRIERLCSENSVTFLPGGDLDETEVMGPQGIDTLLNLLRECEAADGGILTEPRDRLGIYYRTRLALYTPGTVVTLDGGGGTGGDLFELVPTDDDQLTRNDITAERKNGSSSRVEQTTGPLATSAVGRYDEAVTVNVYADDQVDDEASWRLNLGTIDEPRFPTISAHLSRSTLVANPSLTTACVEADLGDGLTVTDPPMPLVLPRTDVRQIIVSRVVDLRSHEYVASWVGQPAAGYDVGIFDYEHPDEQSRYTSDGSTVNGAHTNVATTLSVATPSGPLWSHSDGDLTIYIRETGERMLVTNVTGTSSPQPFTVTRGVDGTTAKALTGVETVELARPIRWGK